MNLKRFDRRTIYNKEKQNKKENYTFLNQNFCIPNQTVIAGDSITEICNMELFDDYIKKTGNLVYNRGISGDTSNRFLQRFDENVLTLNPKNLVLLIGTNDLSFGADIDYIVNNVNSILKITKEKCPNVNIILQSVYPVEVSKKSKNKQIIELNYQLKNLANKYNIIYLDLHTLLLGDDGGFNPNYTYDGLHPNVHGFKVAVSEIIAYLN